MSGAFHDSSSDCSHVLRLCRMLRNGSLLLSFSLCSSIDNKGHNWSFPDSVVSMTKFEANATSGPCAQTAYMIDPTS
ncbi:hypothetical protein Tco_0787286 [Tanacetum coccineum]